jgi:hypothetical protein
MKILSSMRGAYYLVNAQKVLFPPFNAAWHYAGTLPYPVVPYYPAVLFTPRRNSHSLNAINHVDRPNIMG